MTNTDDVTLADEMLRDPGYLVVIKPTGPTSITVALASIYRRIGLEPGSVAPLVAAPATDPKKLIDAKRGGPCLACGQDVWLSPSSSGLAFAVAIVCWPCVVSEIVVTSPAVTPSPLPPQEP